MITDWPVPIYTWASAPCATGSFPALRPSLLPGVVGAACARRLCLFAEYVDADEALRIGLVDRVVPRESLEAAARQLGERASGFSSTARRECKSLLARGGTLDADVMSAHIARRSSGASTHAIRASVQHSWRHSPNPRLPGAALTSGGYPVTCERRSTYRAATGSRAFRT